VRKSVLDSGYECVRGAFSLPELKLSVWEHFGSDLCTNKYIQITR